jgi:hypothetical protein
MNSDKEIRDMFAKCGVDLAKDDVWSVQSSRVVKHKALERLAAALCIQWKQPQVLRAERDEAVILVTGEIERDQVRNTEWSIGEALINANYRVSGKQAPYVYAMAEKRAKDRVILKLAGLHGVYSEDEADDFKQQPGQPAPQHDTVIERKHVPAAETPAQEYLRLAKEAVRQFGNAANLGAWWQDEKTYRERYGVVKGTPEYDELYEFVRDMGQSLTQQKEAAE